MPAAKSLVDYTFGVNCAAIVVYVIKLLLRFLRLRDREWREATPQWPTLLLYFVVSLGASSVAIAASDDRNSASTVAAATVLHSLALAFELSHFVTESEKDIGGGEHGYPAPPLFAIVLVRAPTLAWLHTLL